MIQSEASRIFHGLRHFLSEVRNGLKDPDNQILTTEGNWEDQVVYNEHCQIFNRRIQEKPWVIVYCREEKDVQLVYQTATKYNFEVRIRAGGHDHEGECTGTNVILMDISQMNTFSVDDNGLATIGPGLIFKNLTTLLANENVMIPHGTCATVCISGFTMGGGWGPWTRKHGMCCEHLVGANLVLGDGSTVKVDAEFDENGNEVNVPPLLWALRGGGGMSYALVTEWRIQTFPLPKELIRFSLTWNLYPEDIEHPQEDPDYICADAKTTARYPTLDVLKAWEKNIKSKTTTRLIGTNLMINAKPLLPGEEFDYKTVEHNCVMYGYWQGNEHQLNRFLLKRFKSVPKFKACINTHHGGTDADENFGDTLMSDWARNSYNKLLTQSFRLGKNLLGANDPKMADLVEGKPLPPDYDDPAPHKITSRLVDNGGLKNAGYRQFLRSLTSELLSPESRDLGLFSYVTLGAIVGNFYMGKNLLHPPPEGERTPDNSNTSFPYSDKLYTIQYQTWWNMEPHEKFEGQNNLVWNHTNRALDWMQVARDFNIPNTTGSFISFKDSSIPTEVYFQNSYNTLMDIKREHSLDEFNHLRIRKSIY